MADDAAKPALTPEEQAAKDARIARGRANLLPPIKPGEKRNKTGKNGRTQQAALVKWLEEPSEKGQAPRIERVWQATYLAALKGSAPDRKTLIEQHAGRPKQALDLSSDDGSMSPNRKPTTAETRQELDRVLAALKEETGDVSTTEPKAGP